MAAFATSAQLVDDGAVNPGLCIDETLQIKGVACGFHSDYGGTVPHDRGGISMGIKRRIPKPGDLTPLIRFRKPRLDRTQRRIDDALTIHDLRRIAKRRTPKAAFDYTDGSAEDEISLERARQAFRDVEFHPTIL